MYVPAFQRDLKLVFQVRRYLRMRISDRYIGNMYVPALQREHRLSELHFWNFIREQSCFGMYSLNHILNIRFFVNIRLFQNIRFFQNIQMFQNIQNFRNIRFVKISDLSKKSDFSKIFKFSKISNCHQMYVF